MGEFLSSIPQAASSPLALIAYAISALLFVSAAWKLKKIKTVMKRIALVPEHQRKDIIETVTETKLPEKISAEQWVRLKKMNYLFLIAFGIIISTTAVLGISLATPPHQDGNDENLKLIKNNAFELGLFYQAYLHSLTMDHDQFLESGENLPQIAEQANRYLKFFDVNVQLPIPKTREEAESIFVNDTEKTSDEIDLQLEVKYGKQIYKLYKYSRAVCTYFGVKDLATPEEIKELQQTIIKHAAEIGLDAKTLSQFFATPNIDLAKGLAQASLNF